MCGYHLRQKQKYVSKITTRSEPTLLVQVVNTYAVVSVVGIGCGGEAKLAFWGIRKVGDVGLVEDETVIENDWT
ncbi:hypothetical protein EPI10_020408 [Gossypium australe]|uniref:Uncharacterized protein n=1 Tax=Gossypium australe TaxID=47621 RepID=A0A5B6WFP8_9ROSI|nr:hypothetical protein EPI10_020408 [Gossypium australe]